MNETNSSENQESRKKILVMGLENSGKTSIIFNMLGKDNLMDYLKISPTKGFSIQNLIKGETTFILWEFGGQEASIKEYIKNFKNNATDMEELFFVIDIQDVDKYERAIEYLKIIIDNLIDLDLNIEITIFLHKNDHNLFKKFPNLNELTIENFILKIKETIPHNFYFEIYKTTIYTVLDKIHVY